MKQILLLTILLLLLAACDTAEPVETPQAPPVLDLESTTIADMCAQADIQEPETREYDAAGAALVEGIDYQAILCTDAGAILVDLYEADTPITVNNFVFLAQHDYYNNTIFHRVIEGFMAQAGDPTGTGQGGPGYQFEDEIVTGFEFTDSGILAMANAGAGTNGSQFFITFAPATHLNTKHTIFGEVLQGTRVLNGILRRNPDNGNTPATALRTVLIVQAE
jgi:cyclophilin family peptidyl-prolyl cis-trans isomerase